MAFPLRVLTFNYLQLSINFFLITAYFTINTQWGQIQICPNCLTSAFPSNLRVSNKRVCKTANTVNQCTLSDVHVHMHKTTYGLMTALPAGSSNRLCVCVREWENDRVHASNIHTCQSNKSEEMWQGAWPTLTTSAHLDRFKNCTTRTHTCTLTNSAESTENLALSIKFCINECVRQQGNSRHLGDLKKRNLFIVRPLRPRIMRSEFDQGHSLMSY